MSKLFTGSIDVSKIDKSTLFEGKKGKYLNLFIWINDEPDQFGNTMSIQQKTEKDADKIFLGNAKEYVKQGTISKPDNYEPASDLPF